MTFQMAVTKECKYCGHTINHCGDRGNGKQRDCCDSTCSRKIYVIKKRIANYLGQIKLKKNKFEIEGEFTEKTFQFVELANNYLENNLPAIRIAAHLNAALEGRNASPVKAVFEDAIENKGKIKCLI